MSRVIVVTVPYDGGYYSPDKTPYFPIRIYSDRWIEDDYVKAKTGQKRRIRLSKKEFRAVQKYAKQNRLEGRV